MCGIVGIYLKTKKFEKNLGKMLSGMLNNMESRGPDSAGFAIYKNEGNKIYKFSLCINNLNFNIFNWCIDTCNICAQSTHWFRK